MVFMNFLSFERLAGSPFLLFSESRSGISARPFLGSCCHLHETGSGGGSSEKLVTTSSASFWSQEFTETLETF